METLLKNLDKAIDRLISSKLITSKLYDKKQLKSNELRDKINHTKNLINDIEKIYLQPY